MIATCLIGFCVLLLFGMPVAYGMAIMAAAVIAMDPSLPNQVIAQKIYTPLDSFSFIAIPLFMLAGSLMNSTGITEKIIQFARSAVGHFKGGLAHTTVVTGMLLAGVSGSAVADSSAIATVLVPALDKEGYDRGFAGALVSAVGSLGPIIPPSILMIVYSGVITISVGDLFMAGIVPGILFGILMMIFSTIYAKKHNIPKSNFVGFKSLFKSFFQCLGALIMPFIILGGIVSGIVTATESGILAIVYGIIYGFITRNLDIKKLYHCIKDAIRSSTLPMVVIAFASLFGYVLTYYNLGSVIEHIMTGFTSNGTVVLVLVFVIIYIAGMFVESTAALLILVPIFSPLIQIYGFNALHFAMVCIISLVLGGISPPVGIVMYVVSSVTHTPLNSIIRNIWPFIIIFTLGTMAIIFIPQIVLFVPSLF